MPGRPWWDVAPCGTDAAYQRHRYRHEPADQRCREAHARDRRNRVEDQRARGWVWDKTRNRYAPPGEETAGV